MSAPHGQLARFALTLIAPARGRRDPSVEFALRAILAEPDDRAAGQALWALYQQKAAPIDSDGYTVTQSADLLLGEEGGHQGFNPAQLVWERIVAGQHDAAWGPALARSPQHQELARAWQLWRNHDAWRATQLLRQLDLAVISPELAQLFASIAELLGRSTVPRREPPARGARRTGQTIAPDLERGRASRAELVWEIIRADQIVVREVESNRARRLDREELVDALLRDPRWDDIDAAEQRRDVVDRMLGHDEPSPPISLQHRGLPDVFIVRIQS